MSSVSSQMTEVTFHNRRAHQIENDQIRVTILEGGGHVAEILHKASNINPLWRPPWPSIEPSTFNALNHSEIYGNHTESKLLSGIMGHNLCLPIFGGPSEEEAKAGHSVHGEGSVVPYTVNVNDNMLHSLALLPAAQLKFQRLISLHNNVIRFHETVENLSTLDQPIAWTEHVTIGPPFLEKAVTLFRANATKGKVYEIDLWEGQSSLKPGAEYEWPFAPTNDGNIRDLRIYPSVAVSAQFSTHLMDPSSEDSFFLCYNPKSKVLFGYIWKTKDFPWLGIWEENNCRKYKPWNGHTLTRGLEFGKTPMPETRKQMIQRGSLFGYPSFFWLPARTQVSVDFYAFICTSENISESVHIDKTGGLIFN